MLDNCEHVVEACSRLADALLRRCQRVRILATSREPLGMAGEVNRTGWVRSSCRHRRPPATVRHCSSVRLFIDRALLRRPDLALGDDEMAVIASICQRVDGIPFAIELAAARVNVLGVAEIAATLGDHLALAVGELAGRARPASPRCGR